MSLTEHDLAAVVKLVEREVGDGARSAAIGPWLTSLCKAAKRELQAYGVGLSLFGAMDSWGVSMASDRSSALAEELQFALGEGPCRDAYTSRRPVLVPDLSTESHRWPTYPAAVHRLGINAVFGFPMYAGSQSVGVLEVYRAHPGELDAQALRTAQLFTEAALLAVLEDPEAETGLAVTGRHDHGVNPLELHQAQGMVMVQLDVAPDHALARLRAHAFANDRRLSEVAHDVVARELTFEEDR